MVTADGATSRQYSTGVQQTSCIFEHVYFARPDSRVFGRWVQESRDEMGRQFGPSSAARLPQPWSPPFPASDASIAACRPAYTRPQSCQSLRDQKLLYPITQHCLPLILVRTTE